MEDSSKRLKENRPNGQVLSYIFGVFEGVRPLCADYTDSDIRNINYEVYTTSVEVTSLLAFNFRGELIHAALNYLGSWHDAKVSHSSGLIYPSFHDDQITPLGYAILCDSALTAGAAVDDKIVQARKTSEPGDVFSVEMSAIDLIMQQVLPSERQSAEWLIRAFKALLGLLRLPMSLGSEM